MRRISVMLGTCAWAVLAVSVQPVWGVGNNGFDTDYVYALRTAQGTSPAGEVRVYKESDGTLIDDNLLPALPSPYNWQSLTFSGVGENDARLFLARNNNPTTPLGDIDITEINSSGSTVKSTTLCTIMGLTPRNLGANRAFGNIRFSRGRPTSLFVSAACDISSTTRGMAWEIDLDLSTLKNTYTGPVTPLNDQDTGYTPFRPAHIDVAPDGTVYMVGYYLGRATDAPLTKTDEGLGDLVSFDTSGGSTNVFTTLIDGPTYNPPPPGGGDDRWIRPMGLAFRRANPTDGTPTIQVGQQDASAARAVLEFFLDTTAHPVDGNGNLIFRRTPISLARAWAGQQDEVTGSVRWAAKRGGLHEIKANDSTFSFQPGAWWDDVDSPSSTMPLAPDILAVTPVPDPALVGTQYVKQLSLGQGTLPVTWSLLQGPTGAVIDQTGRISGWTPVWDDLSRTFTFQVRAINSVGADTETWIVKVHPLNNGFVGDYVYAIRNNDGQIRMLEEATGRDMGALAAAETDLDSLAFLGAGKNDARLFVAKHVLDSSDPNNVITIDVKIMEIDSTGSTLQSNTLSAIMGLTPPLSTNFGFGSIRFSQGRPTSLFVSAASDISGTSRGMAWEIDLGLSTLKNTYTGPINPLKVNDTQIQAAHIDMAPDGTLYMSGFHLGQDVDVPNGEIGLGDLVAFDTSGGSTSSFTTLVDGPTFVVSHPGWASPNSPIFRKGRSGRDDGTDTVVVLMNPVAAPRAAQELYLDTTLHPVDGDGNLALRGSPISVPRGWKGHQDLISGDIWLGALRNGVHAIRSNEATSSWQTTVYWEDAARAPFRACNYPSVDMDGDGDVDVEDFAVFQRCYTTGADPPPNGLTATCACFDLGDDDNDGTPDRDGDIDQTDLAVFVSCASGPGVPAEPDCGE